MKGLNHPGIDEFTRFTTEFIEKAGEIALAYYGKGSRDTKFDDDLVTEAELRLTEAFAEALQKRFPDHEIFDSMDEDQDYTHDQRRYLWIFDPIDGVANFQAGIPIWGTSIALVENFWPVLGLFHMPVTRDLYYAVAGDKAYHGTETISVSSSGDINNESLLFTFSRFNHLYNTTFPGKVRNLGCTGAHVCYVAEGRAEGVVLANESYRDLAAARVILEAAGGKFFSVNGEDFFLNEHMDGRKIPKHIIAAGVDTVGQLRECIRPIG